MCKLRRGHFKERNIFCEIILSLSSVQEESRFKDISVFISDSYFIEQSRMARAILAEGITRNIYKYYYLFRAIVLCKFGH